MDSKKICLLFEGAYAQIPALPGYWLRFDDLREKFNELVAVSLNEIVNIDDVIAKFYPDANYLDDYQLTDSPLVFKAIRIEYDKLTELLRVKKNLESAIKSITPINDEGWKPFAAIGNAMKKEDIISMGFVGYRHAVECIFGNRFEFRAGDTSKHEAPVQIRDTKTPDEVALEEKEYDNQVSSIAPPKGVVEAPKQGSYIGDAIDHFAFFPSKVKNVRGWDDAINALKVKALDEVWGDDLTKPILKNYISYTFERLVYEDEQEQVKSKNEGRLPKLKILTNEEFAIWNTGLVNDVYDPIFAFFRRNDGRNPKRKQPWIFIAFDTANSKCQRYIAQFPHYPARASYFYDPRELLYDITAQPPTLDFDHFLKDNIERIPAGFLKRCGGGLFAFEESPDKLSRKQRDAYYKDLAQAIYNDDDWKQFIILRFKNAVSVALSRVTWNYKTAIPVYYNADKKMQLLLPLALEDKNHIDVALVCEHVYNPKKGVNNYQGKTIFTLEMAYNNARLITRPDSDWLMADRCVTR